MITSVLLGAGCGLGLWALVVWAAPPRPPLAAVLARLHHQPEPAPILSADGGGWAARAGRRLTPALQALGLPGTSLGRDLAVLGRDVDAHLAEKATLTILGLLTPTALAVLMALLGASLDPVMPVLLAAGGAALGFLTPDLRVRADAKQRRADFRQALSAYLDLVVVSLAGGAGADGALTDAATVGHGWAFTQLRRALDVARLTRIPPATALARLGTEIGSRDLAELAASLSLAGTEGARVRNSLAARAKSLRTHLLTDTDAAARAATERLGLPWGLLFLGFLIFLGYPALHQILTGL
ncbi:type II secretion system F family protein [Jatrophihabitans lederbergiae]|uniref:Type II secretion system F family protein n=1 Tax=Jatrophihabitans lederbergiae TaxID=3075547 RepID=A0ABU2JF48_9ACTN|nr:type II secretion system F family protein [Jatrophihabitans sp. DSM 44399]MDT0263610.1 type II secretion system F family protein [Jatrophihabitans sp. DSM 44399]